jgi:outer membrane protein
MIHMLTKAGTGVALSIGVFAALLTPLAQAQQSQTIFPEGWDRSVRDRMFMRLNYVSGFVKTRSKDAYDVTGPVISNEELLAARTRGIADSTVCPQPEPLSANILDDCAGGDAYNQVDIIVNAIRDEGLPGLGTPRGIRSRIGNVATPAISLGYWLTDAYDWSLEAYLLAIPLTVKAYGEGVNGSRRPNGLAGKHILTTKMLPPLAILARHFGRKDAPIRPYVGAGVMYAVMYDTRVQDALSSYVGGKTTANVKNAIGVGPFVGLTSSMASNWHVNLSVGQIKLKTEATLTSRNTLIQASDAVIQDYSRRVTGLINLGEDFWRNSQDGTGLTRAVLHQALNGRSDFGTYVRKQKMVLTNTIVSISVGTSF